jgi:hypothetical protein
MTWSRFEPTIPVPKRANTPRGHWDRHNKLSSFNTYRHKRMLQFKWAKKHMIWKIIEKTLRRETTMNDDKPIYVM